MRGTVLISACVLLARGIGAQTAQGTAPDGGTIFGNETQNTSTPSALIEQAYKFLTENLVTGTNFGVDYSFDQPSTFKYGPSQFLWDSGSHQIVWSHRNVTKSILDLRSQLHFLLSDGRIPEEIDWTTDNSSSPSNSLEWSTVAYNDPTQMPVLPYSLRSIWWATQDVALLEEFVPKLVTYFNWWKDTRVVDGTGLVTILHPWESGIDLSPAFDPALGIPEGSRANPTWLQAYFPLLELVLSYNSLYGWDQQKILSRKSSAPLDPIPNWFVMHDIAVNSVYASGWGVLASLADEFNSSLAATCRGNQQVAERAILDNMYNSSLGRFVTLYQDTSNISQSYSKKTVQMLFPLLLNGVSEQQVDEIVGHLTDPAQFWRTFPAPSVSADEPEYQPIWKTDFLWRGPTWGFTNWFIMEGLQKHNRTDVLNAMLDKWIDSAMAHGIWEMYNPDTGVGYGAEGLGMSHLVVDWMMRLNRTE